MTETSGQAVRVNVGKSGMLYDAAFAIEPDMRVFDPGFYAGSARPVSAGDAMRPGLCMTAGETGCCASIGAVGWWLV